MSRSSRLLPAALVAVLVLVLVSSAFADPVVRITRYSNVVTGTIGPTTAGAQTDLVLYRSAPLGAHIVATGTSAVDPTTGEWSASLVPSVTSPPSRIHAVDGRELVVSYSGADGLPAAAGFVNFYTYAGDAHISADGLTGTTPYLGSCADVSFIKNGTVVPTVFTSDASGAVCQATFASAATDEDSVQVRLVPPGTIAVGSGQLNVTADVAPVGVTGRGAPTCNADLVTANVLCSNLPDGSYELIRRGQRERRRPGRAHRDGRGRRRPREQHRAPAQRSRRR